MGTKTLKIVRQIYGRFVQGYPDPYKLYLAEETLSGFMYAQKASVYLLTKDRYNDGYHIQLDTNNIESLKHSSTGTIDGHTVYVERDKILALTGHFKVKHSIPATDPVEIFKGHAIARSEYVLYETEHVTPDSKISLSRVFSKVSPGYWRGESIPANEVTPLVRNNPADKYNYYLHDHDKYQKRLMEAMPKC
jgi:hypothetical protein